MNEKAKLIGKWLIPFFLIIWFPTKFFWDIAHYHTHFEDLTALFLELAGLILCTILIVRAIRRRDWAYVIIVILAMVSCAFFGYWINRIPFCTECDHIRRSELGFMLEPFADRFGYFWPE